MAAAILFFRSRAAVPAEPLRTLRDLVLDPRACSDHRAALMLVAEAAGRPIGSLADLASLTAAEAAAALELVRKYYPDRTVRLAQAIVERRCRP